jgi:ribosomal-protein-alanine N-acetyltransferase
MYEYACRPETSRYLLWSPHPYYSYTAELTRFLQKEYAEGRFFDFAVIWKENMKMIGTAGFTSIDEKNRCIEVGYVLNPDYWGKGIATEALTAIMNFAFCELEANRVEAKYMVGNEVSLRVMEKCGMTHEGILRGKLLVKGKFRDVGLCSILKDEYFAIERSNLYKSCNSRSLIGRLFHKN